MKKPARKVAKSTRILFIFTVLLALAGATLASNWLGVTSMAEQFGAGLFSASSATVKTETPREITLNEDLTIGTCDTAGPIEVESSGGTTTPTAYATLKAAFDAIIAGTHTGDINVEVCGNTTETATAALTASGVGSASYTSVVIRPVGVGRVIEGSIAGAIVRLQGADNVTIDGRQGGAGTARDLTIRNNNTSTATAAIWLSSVAAGNGASSNTIRNLEIVAGQTANTGTNTTIGVYMGGSTISLTATDGNDNDNNQFLFNRITRARYGLATRSATANNSEGLVIADNIVGPNAFGPDEIGKAGIYLQADTGAQVTRNTVQFVGGDFANTTAGADRCGICIGGENWSVTDSTTITSGDYTVTKNIIHDIIEERTFSAIGIKIGTTRSGSPTNNLIANNFIYNVRSNGTGGDQTVGIGYSNGNTDRIINNSIRLTGDVDPGATTLSTTYANAIRVSQANAANNANLLLANNSIYLDLTSDTAANRYYAITLNSAAYVFGTGALNYNNYYINASNTQLRTGGLSTTGTGSAATTEFQTLANWQAALTAPQDVNSIQSNPLYLSATDLHIPAGSPNVGAGLTIAGLTDDIDGEVRPNGGTYEIGADEFYATPGTLQLSSATYAANENTTASVVVNRVSGSTGTVGATLTITDGTATGGAACGVGVDYVNPGPQTLTFADGVTSQTVNVQVCSDLVVDPGETFIATLSAPTGGALLGSPTVANTTITDVPPPFNGTYNVGTGETYTSLTNPGGIFEAINLGGVSANVTINLTSDLTAETGAVALNEFAGGFSLTIKPSGGDRIVSGSSTFAVIRINGADNVTIDGSLTGGAGTGIGGTAALRNLTVINTNAAATAGAVIAVTQGGSSANSVTVKNVNVSGQAFNQTLIGIHVGANTVGASPTVASNTNIVIDNCSFKKSFIAIFNNGVSAAIPATGSVVSHNDLSATGTDRLRRAGIFFFNQNGIQVTENKIGGIAADEAADAIGIIAGVQNVTATAAANGGVFNALISRNQIDVITSTSTTGFSAVGIAVAGDPTAPNTVSNNVISGVSAPSTSPDITAGIFVAGVVGSNTKVYNNSVSLTGERGAVASQIGSYGIAISGADPTVELKNNIFYNAQTSGGGANAKSYAIGMTATTFANLDSNFNDFFSSGANAAGFRTGSLDTTGTDLANLAAWQVAVADDANSAGVDPAFVNPVSDLHLQVSSPASVLDAGTPLAAVTVDFENQPRSATTPDIGADEADFVAPDTQILTNPTNPSTSADATFTFSGTDSAVAVVVSFECKLDAGAFAACTSPQTYTALSQGSHTFQVRAVDGAGNVDATPASYTWFVDAIAPDTQILSQPTDPSNSANATFTFGGTDSLFGSPLTFQCKLDAAAFAVCTSPQNYTGLADGSHTFQVRAIDAAGNIDPTPASYTWTVATGPSGPVTVTATAGTATGTYTNLTAAVAAINDGTHQGAIVVNVNQSVTEPASVVLNGTGAGAAVYTSVLIRPTADGLSVSGPTVQGRGLIELNGADNVTIDGDNPNSAGTNRDLTIQNTAANTVTFTSVIRIAVAATVVTSADGNTIKNLKILGNATGRNISTATSTTASENTTFGIFAGPNASTVTATTAPSPLTSVSTSVGTGATASNLLVSNNEVMSVARAVSMNGSATTVFPGLVISNNRIGNQTAGAPDQVYSIGITGQGSANGLISGNTVWVEGFVASSAATHGINVGVNSAVGTFTIENNKVNRVLSNNVSTFSAFGINLGGGVNHVVQNNFVSGVRNDQTAGTGAFSVTFGAFGIRVGSGTGHKIYHNSVHLYGAIPGTVSTDLTAAFGITGTGLTGVDVRNNIFSNQLSGGNPTGTRNVAVFLPTGATAALNLTWNNNAYFAGTDALNRLAQVGTTFGAGEFLVANFDPTSTTPATNLRAYTSTLSAAGTNDNASFASSGAPPFTSNVDLHIPAATSTRLESGGAAVGVATDIDLETRNATTPDIGGDEFAGTPAAPNDIAAGVFVSPLNGANVPTGASFTPQATFVNQGTATQTGVTVRYKIIDSSMATVYDQTATIATIAPLQSVAVSFPAATLTAAGTYTIQAIAELAGDSNSSNDQISGTINALTPFSGTINVGTGETFTSLTNAGGIFQALNNAGISGNTTINITSDLTAETGSVVLNQLTEAGVGGYTVTFKPSGAARVISGTSAASSALIKLNGADRIVFDGSLSGGTDRSLTISNSQTGTSTIFWIAAVNAGNAATNNTIKNCIINGSGTTTAQTTAGILGGSGTTIGGPAEAPNNNNTVTNNRIFAVQNGIYNQGNTGLDQNWTVTNNEFGSAVEVEKNRFRGMLMGNANNFTISGNSVLGVTNFTGTTGANTGIQLAFFLSNGTVTNNRISNVRNLSASGTGAFGMQLGATTTSNVLIANNFIWDVQALGSATVTSNAHGITINGAATTGAYKIYHNSINMNVDQASGTSAALNVTSAVVAAGAIDLRNNILANTQTTGATRFGVFSAAAANVFSTIDYNDYFAQNVGSLGGTTRTTLGDWQTATGQDVNSLAVNPLFVSATDLHLQTTSPVLAEGVGGLGVTTDIDGQTRDAVPDMGADEILAVATPGTVQFSAPTYSVGEAGGTVTLTLTRTGGSAGAISATYGTANGTATGGASCGAGVDFVSITGGTANWVDGDTAPKTFDVTICNDAAFEGNENFTASISATTGGATIGSPSSATVTITDDDPAPTGTVSINNVRVDEGNTGGANAVFTVTYTGSSPATASVDFATASGTAQSGVDFVATSGTLNFSSGSSLTVTVPIIGKTLKEANETFVVNLSNPVNATITDNQGVGIIVDEDRAYVSDFDRDLAADLSVFRPSEGTWYVFRSASLSPLIVPFGSNGDRPVPGDYDGDGLTDLAVYRPSEGKWYVTNSTTSTVVTTTWGTAGDKPVQADYDGDGKTDVAIFRPSDGNWWIIRSSDSASYTVNFGISTDLPMQGDYDGDFKTDQAVYRSGVWYALLSSNSSVQVVNFGLATDKPVSGDFDGDGRNDAAIFRDGDWWYVSSLTGTSSFVHWGLAGDVPVPADYDADGTTDIAIYRPSTGEWYVLRSSDNSYFSLQWGLSGDIPIPSAYIPQ